MRAAFTEIENHRPRTHPGTVAKQLGPKSSRRRRRTNPQAPEPTAGTRTGGVGCCQRRTNHERTHPPQLIANRERLGAPRHEREDDKWARQLEDAQNGTYDQAGTEGGQPDQPVVDEPVSRKHRHDEHKPRAQTSPDSADERLRGGRAGRAREKTKQRPRIRSGAFLGHLSHWSFGARGWTGGRPAVRRGAFGSRGTRGDAAGKRRRSDAGALERRHAHRNGSSVNSPPARVAVRRVTSRAHDEQAARRAERGLCKEEVMGPSRV
ncbi:hypothetical protein pipiens_006650 [Culex pipiens pipiens]|uniref:Uncharacterized protein n=1 Tax=Culex pipiens pipiens TaxID=38569 RepID=A0ABD1DP44_CULPP